MNATAPFTTSGASFITQNCLVQVKPDTPEFECVCNIFRKYIQPIYGPQESALRKIANGTNRTCELLYSQQMPVGLLVYKLALTDEYQDEGLMNSLEIKTLIVIDSAKNSRKGFGTQLITRAQSVAQKALALNIHVTISSSRPKVVHFFKKHGFRLVKTWHNKFTEGIDEYLFAKAIWSSKL